MPQLRRHGAAVLILTLLAGAAPATAQIEAPPQGRDATIPSFNESPGCDGPSGIRGPYATRAGDLSPSEPISGPWGDFFGRDIAEVRSRLVAVPLPSTGGTVTVYVHQRAAPALRAVIRNLQREAAAGRVYDIRRWDTYSYRAATVPPHRYLSFHAVGAAIDVNAATNPYRLDNVLVTDMPDWFVKAWTDAGWCWGGAWQDLKDAMHFSWQGPLATPGYLTPDPIPPRTQPAAFTRSLSFPTVLGPAPEGARLLLADLDRDGAVDPVRVRAWTPSGHLGVEAAQAIHGFETCYTGEVTSFPGVPGASLLLADYSGDGRPDLWEIDASGRTVLLSAYTLASGFSRRFGPTETAVPTSAGMVFLVGDHNRDRRADLYVVRPGDPTTIEVWRGPRFTPALEAVLPFATGEGWRFALGERDGDGVPDLYALSPEDPARAHIVPGGSGFTGPAEVVRTAVSGHDGEFAVSDLDGDGRDDLYFFDADGTVTAYLGGRRGITPDGQLTYWFYEGHDPHWQYGEGCPADPGATFRALEVAGAGSGMAVLYEDPIGGGWVLAGWAPGTGRFADALPGTGLDLAALPTPEGDRFALLQVAGGTIVHLYDPGGALAGRVGFGRLVGPIRLIALTVDGAPALGVLDDRGDRAALTVRALDGTLLAVVPLGRFDPTEAAPLAADADGSPEIVVLGTGPGGEALLRVVALDGALLAEAALPAGSSVESLAVAAGALPVLLLRDDATGRARVQVFDETLTPITSLPLAPDRAAVLAAVGGDVVVAYREWSSGNVRVLSRDALTGEQRYLRSIPSGFDPAVAAAAGDGTLVLAGHRLGDGTVLTERRDAEGALVARVQHWMR
jgi:hypothetical protein